MVPATDNTSIAASYLASGASDNKHADLADTAFEAIQTTSAHVRRALQVQRPLAQQSQR